MARKLGLRSRSHQFSAAERSRGGGVGRVWRLPTTHSTRGASSTLIPPITTKAVRQPRLSASRPPPSRLAALASGMDMVMTASGADRFSGTKLRAT